jgi:hypothetical protein
VRTYARSGGRALLYVVRTYKGGPPDVRSANCTGRTYVGPSNVRYFLNTLWLIHGRTRQPLDRWTRNTGRTPLGRTSTAFWAYKYNPTPFVFCISCRHPQAARMFPECSQSVLSVLCEHVRGFCVFQNIREVKLLWFCFKEVTFDP